MIRYTLWGGANFHGYYSNLLKTLSELDKNRDWDVEIKRHRKKKSDSQRGWFHVLCDIWGERIGLTPGQIKEVVKGHYFGYKPAITIAGIEIQVADGSSEDLDNIGYSALIETLYRLAAESGEVLPDADRQ